MEEEYRPKKGFKAFVVVASVILGLPMAIAILQKFGPERRIEKPSVVAAKEEVPVKEKGPCDGIVKWPDGRPLVVKQFMSNALNDPKSFSLIQRSDVEFINGMCAFRCSYRAKNGFGALVVEDRTFFMSQDGAILKVETN